MWQLGARRDGVPNDHGCGQHDHCRHSEAFPAPARNFWVPKVMPRRRQSSRQSFQTLRPAEPFRLRSHSKRLSRDVLLYERKALSVREKEPTKWRHGSPAESGLSRACRPWPPGGRQTTKRAVSVKVSADGPRLLALAVPVNQRTVPGGPGGDFYGRRAHGRARCRADGIPGGGKGLKRPPARRARG